MAATESGASAKAILYAFLANLGIALSKTWAAIHTGSGSLLAEAIHSYADSGNQVLLFIGLKRSQRPPDVEHPLGYGKVTYFWAFIVAMLLFSVGGLFSIYEGIHKWQNPEPLSQAWIGLIVLAAAVVLEALSLAGCLREIAKLRGTTAFRDWLRHTRNAELVVVFGEDVAALVGLVIAFVFLGLAIVTGDPTFDAVGSISIGVVLIIVSVFISIRMRSLIVGRSAEPDLRRLIARLIDDDETIDELLNSITLQFGPDVMLAAKIRLKPNLSVEEAVQHINTLERRLKERAPQIKWCFIEPDVVD